ncbi:MAG: MFS transporter, partial [Deltaproteobacteria bacterium]|nr:MFS transporter [Deltaproteobacteria bacterium]
MAKADPYAALRFRDYRRFAAGLVLSILGEQMIDVAIGWEIYERTNSASMLGFAGLAEGLPFMLLAVAGGHASDRYDRRSVLVLSQLALAVCSLGLAAVSLTHGRVELMFACIVLAGAARAFKSPARSALLPQLVPNHVLKSAVTWNSSMFQMASMAGPMIGGFLVAGFGHYHLVYELNALLCLSFLVLLATIPRASRVDALAKEPVSWRSALAGFTFIKKTPLILATITLDLFAALLGGAVALLPIFAKDILHVGATGLGWLRAAPA